MRGTADGAFVLTDGTHALGEVPVSPSREWREFSAPVSLPFGKFALYFVFRGGGAADFSEFSLK